MTVNLASLPQGVRLGVSPLSWTNEVLADLGGDTPVETCLSEASDVGYQGVELGRKLPREPERLAALLESYGLALISGWHSGELAAHDVAAEMEAARSHAQLLKALGCDVFVYGEVAMMTPGDPLEAPMSQRLIMPQGEIPAYAARLTELSRRLAGEYGLRLAYHHHLMMVAETFDEISSLFDKTGPEAGLLLDTGHAVAGGFDYAQLIERFGERIAHIHLKDVRGDVMGEVRSEDISFNTCVRKGMFTVPGDGKIDFGPLARFVKQSGYRGWLVVEAEQDPLLAPPKPAVSRAFDHVLKTFQLS